jgi:hypothetical protein
MEASDAPILEYIHGEVGTTLASSTFNKSADNSINGHTTDDSEAADNTPSNKHSTFQDITEGHGNIVTNGSLGGQEIQGLEEIPKNQRINETYWPYLKSKLASQPDAWKCLALTCRICYADMRLSKSPMQTHQSQDSTLERTAQILPCGHIFCNRCLPEMKLDRRKELWFDCYVCRKSAKLAGCSYDCKILQLPVPANPEALENFPLTVSEGGRLPRYCFHCSLKIIGKANQSQHSVCSISYRPPTVHILTMKGVLLSCGCPGSPKVDEMELTRQAGRIAEFARMVNRGYSGRELLWAGWPHPKSVIKIKLHQVPHRRDCHLYEQQPWRSWVIPTGFRDGDNFAVKVEWDSAVYDRLDSS